MPKDRLSANPATAQLKADKAKALKKSKAAVAAQRAERLAQRNPDRLQRQIDELKAEQEASGGKLRPRDKERLEGLERDVRVIRKAREGGKGAVPVGVAGRGGGSGRGGEARGGGVFGKRRRGSDAFRESSSDTDDGVEDITMPRDASPPIPPRQRRGPFQGGRNNANETPLGVRAVGTETEGAARTHPHPHPLPPKPVVQTTYSSAPQIRDLRKEATAKFVPAAVAQRLKERKEEAGRLLEPEEVDEMERVQQAKSVSRTQILQRPIDLEAEEAAFELEIEAAQMEEDAADDDSAVFGLRSAAMRDAGEAAEAAVQEAEFQMMAEEDSGGGAIEGQESAADRHLRHVEMEDAADDGD